MILADALAQLNVRESPWRIQTVAAVGPTKVSVDLGEGVTEELPCLSSYRHRAVGDKVVSVATSVGWLILGRVGAEDVD